MLSYNEGDSDKVTRLSFLQNGEKYENIVRTKDALFQERDILMRPKKVEMSLTSYNTIVYIFCSNDFFVSSFILEK